MCFGAKFPRRWLWARVNPAQRLLPAPGRGYLLNGVSVILPSLLMKAAMVSAATSSAGARVQSSIHGYASVGGWLPSESATCWMSAATPLPLLVVFLLPVPAMYTCRKPPFGAASAYQAANCGIPVRASQLSSAEPPLLTCPPDSAKPPEDIGEEMPSGAGLFGHVGNSDAHRDVRCCPVAVRGL